MLEKINFLSSCQFPKDGKKNLTKADKVASKSYLFENGTFKNILSTRNKTKEQQSQYMNGLLIQLTQYSSTNKHNTLVVLLVFH